MSLRLRDIRPLTLVAALLAASPAFALTIYDYDSGANERFDSGFPSTPVENDSFFLDGFDLSGIGWRNGSNTGLTLVSPQHFLTAAHVAPSAGDLVSFFNTDGEVKTYTVDSKVTLQHSEGVNTDLSLVRLSAAIAEADNVTSYPTLILPTLGSYAGLDVVMFGKSQVAGANTFSEVGFADILPFNGGDTVVDHFLWVTEYNAVSGDTQAQGGDSGSPVFSVVNGQLALLGVNSAIATVDDTDITVGPLIPYYATLIDAQLQLDGYSFNAFTVSAVPEPATVALCSGAVILAFAAWRRRRLRNQH